MNVYSFRMVCFLRLCAIGFVAMVVSSCSTDELNDTQEPTDEDVIDIGDYYVLEESIAKLPYLGKKEIVFVDSLGTSVRFDIDEEDVRQGGEVTLYNYDVVEVGDTAKYSYTSERKSFVIGNDELGMTFHLTLEARPYYPDPEGGFVADVLDVFCVNPDPNIYSSQVFYNVTNSRTWPSLFSGEPQEELEILGVTFFNVYSNNFSSPKSRVQFNYDFGILSFTDMEGKLWRFQELI